MRILNWLQAGNQLQVDSQLQVSGCGLQVGRRMGRGWERIVVVVSRPTRFGTVDK